MLTTSEPPYGNADSYAVSLSTVDVKNVFTFFILVTFFTFLTFFNFPYVFKNKKRRKFDFYAS